MKEAEQLREELRKQLAAAKKLKTPSAPGTPRDGSRTSLLDRIESKYVKGQVHVDAPNMVLPRTQKKHNRNTTMNSMDPMFLQELSSKVSQTEPITSPDDAVTGDPTKLQEPVKIVPESSEESVSGGAPPPPLLRRRHHHLHQCQECWVEVVLLVVHLHLHLLQVS